MLDQYLETSLKCGSKLVYTNYMPLFGSVELTHPDTAKVGLGTGMNNMSSGSDLYV